MKRLAALVLAAAATNAWAQSATFTVKLLTPETALKAAQAALAKCRAEGFQVAVAVVDRGGVAQVVLRDRFAAPHTVETAQKKAATSVNFRSNTTALDKEMQAGRPAAGLRHLPNLVAVGGGMPIEAGGSLLGGIGISGAPGPANDDVCAAAGIKAIAEDLEF